MKRRRGAKVTALALSLGLGGAAALGVVRPALAAGVTLCLEAEAGKLTDPVTLYKSKDCSGAAGIEVPEGANPKAEEGKPPPKLTGECTLTFKVPKDGTYSLWARAWWLDGCGSSLPSRWMAATAQRSAAATMRWHWCEAPLQLTAGTYARAAQHGGWCAPDQIFLTSDAAIGGKEGNSTALVK